MKRRSRHVIHLIIFLVARVGWEQLNYTINETAMAGEACVLVFNPPTDAELVVDIELEYQSVTGTAGTLGWCFTLSTICSDLHNTVSWVYGHNHPL